CVTWPPVMMVLSRSYLGATWSNISWISFGFLSKPARTLCDAMPRLSHEPNMPPNLLTLHDHRTDKVNIIVCAIFDEGSPASVYFLVNCVCVEANTVVLDSICRGVHAFRQVLI